jgi:hypothetical protein
VTDEAENVTKKTAEATKETAKDAGAGLEETASETAK